MPSIPSTPISEFNRSQLLLSLIFPILYPRSEADFVYPRLRLITYGHGNNCQSVAEKYSLRDCIEVSFCRIRRYTDERLPGSTSIRTEGFARVSVTLSN